MTFRSVTQLNTVTAFHATDTAMNLLYQCSMIHKQLFLVNQKGTVQLSADGSRPLGAEQVSFTEFIHRISRRYEKLASDRYKQFNWRSVQ